MGNLGRAVAGCALGLVVLLLTAPAAAGGWEQINQEEGITVSSKEVANSPLVAFRGVAVLDYSIERLFRVIGDNDHRKNWVDRLDKTLVLERTSHYDFVLYQTFGLPVPISNRDYVYRGTATRSKTTGTVTLHLASVTHAKAPATIGVRARLIDSFYRLTPLGPNRTRVEIEVHTDPKGWLPAWLVNMIQKSWPLETLTALREEAGKAWVTPLELPPAE